MSLRLLWAALVRGEKKGAARLLVPVLLFLSLLFRCAVLIRSLCYRWGIFHSKRASIPVVSIGNIVVGGSGKTPVTLMLARMFEDAAIVSRGYRGSLRGPHVVSENDSVESVGDEPALLAKQSNALVIVSKDRYSGVELAAEKGARFALLDDGMQYLGLYRDKDIVVVDSNDPLGGGALLPAGFLREPLSALKRADLIIATRFGARTDGEKVASLLAPYSSAPVVGMATAVSRIERLDNQRYPITKVGIFCALAFPNQFRDLVRAHADIVDEFFLDDHASFTPENLGQFAQRSKEKGAICLLCTEKDRVKLPKYLDILLPIAVVHIEMTVVFGENHWRTFLSYLGEMRK